MIYQHCSAKNDSERRYKLEQQQRAIEREIRKAKRKVEGFTDPENIKKAKAELRQAQKKLKDFIEQTNAAEGTTVLKRDYGKETSYGAAELTETEKNAIIKQEKAAKEAARRAKEYSGNWTKASLSETVAKFGLDKQSLSIREVPTSILMEITLKISLKTVSKEEELSTSFREILIS